MASVLERREPFKEGVVDCFACYWGLKENDDKKKRRKKYCEVSQTSCHHQPHRDKISWCLNWHEDQLKKVKGKAR